MRASRQDEVFEECLSALLEGRRTIAESVSLYPSLADRLRPFLETAAHASKDLGQLPLPSAQVQEQIRARVLAHARTGPHQPSSAAWLDRRWAFLGSAAVVALASALLAALVIVVSR